MVSKIFFSFFASALLLQSVYGQCINNYNQAPVTVGLNGFSSGCGLSGLNLGSNVYNAAPACNGAAAVSSPGYAVQTGPLSVASGSYTTPNGISVFAENLEILGQVGITGSLPFIGAIAVDGAVPSNGQATVVYNSAPGVGLTSGGCGEGLSGLSGNALSGAVLNNGLVGIGSNNLLGGNVINTGYSSLGGCGCY